MKRADGYNFGLLQAKYKGTGYYNRALVNEPVITSAVKDTAVKVGMEPLGLEHRVKTRESYLRKVETNYSPTGTTYEVKDIIRYTLSSSPETLSEKTLKAFDSFEEIGYHTTEVKNTWLNADNPYKGINTTVSAPNGQRFEVQYHTTESFALKNGPMHALYEKQRLLADPTSPEYVKLRDEMFALSDTLIRPDHIEEVKKQ